jgi:hypothetical protein
MLRFTPLLALNLTVLTITPASSTWVEPSWPLDSIWSAEYRAPETEYGPGHRGLDLTLEVNASIKAPTDGNISFADLVVDRTVVTIITKSGYLVSFEPACTNLKVGDTVRSGSEFARHCEPASDYRYHCESCVHFSVRSQFGYLSPEYFLAGLSASVLLD